MNEEVYAPGDEEEAEFAARPFIWAGVAAVGFRLGRDLLASTAEAFEDLYGQTVSHFLWEHEKRQLVESTERDLKELPVVVPDS